MTEIFVLLPLRGNLKLIKIRDPSPGVFGNQVTVWRNFLNAHGLR